MKIPLEDQYVIVGIDQSLSGTGLAAVTSNFPKLTVLGTQIVGSKEKGMRRLEEIVDEIIRFISQHTPAVIAMEDFTRMASSSSLVPLIELATIIKYRLYKMGLEPIIQNQSSMKKFVFGHGLTEKDSSYLLKVLDITGERFPDDNAADAYLHTWLMAEKIAYATGKRNVHDLPGKQRDTLLAMGQKISKLSDAKFKKLTDREQHHWFCQSIGWLKDQRNSTAATCC